MKETKNIWIWWNFWIFTFINCVGCSGVRQSASQQENQISSNSNVWIVSQQTHIRGLQRVDQQVLILPGGLFVIDESASLTFTKPVTILSRQLVFPKGLEVEILPGAFSFLDISWWGADGMDDKDDTEAIQRVFDLASKTGSIEIRIPIGQYYINDQLRMSGQPGNHEALVLHGVSTSYDGLHGSSLIWNGNSTASMLLIANTSQTVFENLDFNAKPGTRLLSNIEFRPHCNQINFMNCYFSGCVGDASCNINLNEGNNLQVSEIFFDNCIFKGMLTDKDFTDNAIRGGLANTKNFHFNHCAFGPYRKEAISIGSSDVLKVEGCTFYLNDIDIRCETCKTIAIGNYSEESGAFFMTTASANFNATTLINNQFTGKPVDGYVVRDGSGTLILINNNFGAGNYLADRNMIRWEENDFNSIYSVGNVYKNSSPDRLPFYNRQNLSYRKDRLSSFGDLGGVLGEGRIKLPDNRN